MSKKKKSPQAPYHHHTPFRSEKMACCLLIIPKEITYDIVSELGEHELIEVVNMNVSHYDKHFIDQVKMCEELEGRLRRLIRSVKREGIDIPFPTKIPHAPPESELVNLVSNKQSSLKKFLKIRDELNEVEGQLTGIKENLQKLIEKMMAITHAHNYVSRLGTRLHPEISELKQQSEEDRAKLGVKISKFRIYAGIVEVTKVPVFETLVWRISKGNAVLQFTELDQSLMPNMNLVPQGPPITTFILMYQGKNIDRQIKKLCEGFSITLHQISNEETEREDDIERTSEDINNIISALNETKEVSNILYHEAAQHLRKWFLEVLKMKSVYFVLNQIKWQPQEKHAIIKCWIPYSNLQYVNIILSEIAKTKGADTPVIELIKTDEEPPTFNRLNKFTYGFQMLIDAYGIPSYQELNPMPYTVITFPFLFAVMFGDVGHAFILAMAACLMIYFEDLISKAHFTNELITITFGGRYIILLMGIFSLYTGIIYNDIFSKVIWPMTSWRINCSLTESSKVKYYFLDPTTEEFTGLASWICFDPIWKVAENEIIFVNSVKMKMSIIIGVIHMSFGLFLSLCNHLHFKNYLAIFTEFIPRILFYWCIFGYMVFLIVFKWAYYNPKGTEAQKPRCAPSVLITFINMVLFTKGKNTVPGCNEKMYPGQDIVELSLMITALCCIPWMLLIEPLIHRYQQKKSGKAAGEESSAGIWVHQIIHTIEYALGTVSYTASYLRLWALSLAHSQLSHVCWNMVMVMGYTAWPQYYFGAIPPIFMFAVWAILSFAVLVVMEGLSAFLHALRLHWMEFQNKFYTGGGHYFAPYTYKKILEEARVSSKPS